MTAATIELSGHAGPVAVPAEALEELATRIGGRLLGPATRAGTRPRCSGTAPRRGQAPLGPGQPVPVQPQRPPLRPARLSPGRGTGRPRPARPRPGWPAPGP